MTKKIDIQRNKLLTLIMDNPCLSVEIDYLPNSERLKFYKKYVNTLSLQEIEDELTDYED